MESLETQSPNATSPSGFTPEPVEILLSTPVGPISDILSFLSLRSLLLIRLASRFFSTAVSFVFQATRDLTHLELADLYLHHIAEDLSGKPKHQFKLDAPCFLFLRECGALSIRVHLCRHFSLEIERRGRRRHYPLPAPQDYFLELLVPHLRLRSKTTGSGGIDLARLVLFLHFGGAKDRKLPGLLRETSWAYFASEKYVLWKYALDDEDFEKQVRELDVGGRNSGKRETELVLSMRFEGTDTIPRHFDESRVTSILAEARSAGPGAGALIMPELWQAWVGDPGKGPDSDPQGTSRLSRFLRLTCSGSELGLGRKWETRILMMIFFKHRELWEESEMIDVLLAHRVVPISRYFVFPYLAASYETLCTTSVGLHFLREYCAPECLFPFGSSSHQLIHYAATTGAVDVVQLMIEAGIVPDVREKVSPGDVFRGNGATPFLRACESGQLGVLEYLLSLEGDGRVDCGAVNADGENAFHLCCTIREFRKSTAVAAILMQVVPELVLQPSLKGELPSDVAFTFGCLEMVVWMHEIGGVPFEKMKTPVSLLFEDGVEHPLASLLVRERAIDLRRELENLSRRATLPLLFAVKSACAETVMACIDVGGAEVVALRDQRGHSALDVALQSLTSSELSDERGVILRLIRENGGGGIDLRSLPCESLLLFRSCCWIGEVEIVRSLLELEAVRRSINRLFAIKKPILMSTEESPLLRMHSSYAVLHVACAKNNPELADILLENGAKVNLRARNRVTPLRICVPHSDHELAQEVQKDASSTTQPIPWKTRNLASRMIHQMLLSIKVLLRRQNIPKREERE